MNITQTKKIRVLVVDDSSFMRKVISDILSADPLIDVVGTARDGEDGLAQFKKLSPDVLTVDVEMPRKNGLEFLHDVMRIKPTPVIMVSSVTGEGASVTMKALSSGAVDFVTKPSGSISLDMVTVGDELRQKVRMASGVGKRMGTVISRPLEKTPQRHVESQTLTRSLLSANKRVDLVVVASSTGGPRALQELLATVKKDFPAPIVIVQHMPVGFTGPLATRLNELSELNVVEGAEGLKIKKGMAVIAPGGYHMVVRQTLGEISCHLLDTPPVRSVKPAADVLFASVAKEVSCQGVIAVVLTGMGRDGTDGVRLLREGGARVIAQSRETCVVYGMPQSVVEAGLADEVLPLDAISLELERLATTRAF